MRTSGCGLRLALDDGYEVMVTTLAVDHAEALAMGACFQHGDRILACLRNPVTRAEHADLLAEKPEWAAMTAPAG